MFSWEAKLEYVSTSGKMKGTFKFTHQELGGKWAAVIPAKPIRGGTWTVVCSATVQGQPSTQDVAFAVKGNNPDPAAIQGYIGQITVEPMRRTMLKAIARHETAQYGGFTQFCPAGYQNYGWPVISIDGRGAGIFQITTNVSYDDHWNWQTNTDDALKLLNEAIGRATVYLNKHPGYTDKQLRLESYAQYGPAVGIRPYYHVWDGKKKKWVKDPKGRTSYADTVSALEEE
jgi:hypothetical protein